MIFNQRTDPRSQGMVFPGDVWMKPLDRDESLFVELIYGGVLKGWVHSNDADTACMWCGKLFPARDIEAHESECAG